MGSSRDQRKTGDNVASHFVSSIHTIFPGFCVWQVVHCGEERKNQWESFDRRSCKSSGGSQQPARCASDIWGHLGTPAWAIGTFGDTTLYIWDIWGHHPGLMDIWGIDCLERQINGCVHLGTPVSNLFGRQGIAKKRKDAAYMESIVFTFSIVFLGVFSHKYGQFNDKTSS